MSKEKKEKLEGQGVKLITKVRRKMKEPELTSFEKLFLGFRGIVETVIDQFKSICHIEHTRHRSPDNFLINLLSGLVAYIFKPRKPNVKLNQLQVLTPN